jgi:serine/threonine-protein kinase RsbW
MAEVPHVRLTVSSRAENVTLVRQVLAGMARDLGVDAIELNDISTAVTEACNNVVLHAYGEDEGPLEVDISVVERDIEVRVRDHGCGFQAVGETIEEINAGLGLHVMQALAKTLRLSDPGMEGTEVTMRFEGTDATLPQPGDEAVARLPELSGADPANTIELAIAPPALARSILPRVLSAIAARSHFSTDRVADAQLLADALVANRDGSVASSHIVVDVAVSPRTLELRVGPLRAGHAAALIQDATVHELGPVIERLAEEHRVVPIGSEEMLALRLSER